MPALPNVAKVIRFDLFQKVGINLRVQNRIFMRYTGALSNADLLTVLATMSAAWNTNMSPNLSSTSQLNSIKGTDLSSNLGAQAVNSTARVGTSVVTDLPASAALIVRFKIAKRYRGGHPRFYLGGMGTISLATNETWTGGAVGAFTAAFTNFIAAAVLAPPAAVGTLTHVSVNYFAGFHNVTFPSGRARAVPTLLGSPLTNDVLSYSVNPIVGTQRRRTQQSI